MTQEIDARGLACPAPVLLTKDTLDKGRPEQIRIFVDNEPARQNVTRFLESRQYTVSSEGGGNDFSVTGLRQGDAEAPAPDPTPKKAPGREADVKILAMVTSSRMGRGDDTLGAGLMVNFIKTLKEMGPELWRLVFVNSGVHLCVTGAQTIDDLKDLEKSGVSILVCGTCLNHFNLLEQKEVGETTNMLDIVTSLQLADRVINI